MIIYNFKKNGSYEYDKFILNIFQICNDVSELKDIYKNSLLLNYINIVNSKYDLITGDTNDSITLYKHKLELV